MGAGARHPGIERNRVTGRLRTNFKHVYDNAKG
jgi:uncharacterized Fe-S cluster-containing protein